MHRQCWLRQRSNAIGYCLKNGGPVSRAAIRVSGGRRLLYFHLFQRLYGLNDPEPAVLQDMLTQQAVCTNGYLALDVLKKTGREMIELLARVNADGTTIIVVTHEEDIARHARRIVRLRDGLIESDELAS